MSIFHPTIAPGEVPSDALQALGGPRTAYTPTINAASGGLDLGSGGSETGEWWQAGAEIRFHFDISFAGSGVAPGTGIYSILLPPAEPALPLPNNHFGQVILFDASATSWHGAVAQPDPGDITKMRLIFIGGGFGASGLVDNDSPVTWAANDWFSSTVLSYPFAE